MTNEEEQEVKLSFFYRMARNFGAKPNEELKGLFADWLLLLHGYTVEEVAAAVELVIRRVRNVPYGKVPYFAEIQSALNDLRRESDKMLKTKAIAEFAATWNCISSARKEERKKLHPVTLQTVRCLGNWDALGYWNMENRLALQREFVGIWLSLYMENSISQALDYTNRKALPE